jgi:predicted amidohydrolase
LNARDKRVDFSMLRVSVISFSAFDSPQKFFDEAAPRIERAAREGAQLVVLPNLALPIPRETLIDFFSALARRAQIYLAPGTLLAREGDSLFNTAYLFAADGKLVGTQRQTHRSPHEIAQGFAQGDELNVFDLGIARVGFVIGTDVEYSEVSRILALQGANVLIHPAAYATWSREHFLLDLWREVQSNQVFGVQACIAGKGQSAIYAPVEMTADHRGVLAQSNSGDIISATLDFEALQQVIDAYPIFDFFNYDLYSSQFPNVYLKATHHATRRA